MVLGINKKIQSDIATADADGDTSLALSVKGFYNSNWKENNDYMPKYHHFNRAMSTSYHFLISVKNSLDVSPH